MAQPRGTKTAVAIYDETAYGVAPGAPDGRKLYYTAFNVAMKQALLQSKTLSAVRAMRQPALGNIDVAGSLSCELAPENLGYLLKHLMGTDTPSGAGPYTHVFTISDLPTSFLLEKDNSSAIAGAGRFEQNLGCRVAQARFSFPAEGYPEVTFDIRGASQTPAAAVLDASLTDTGCSPLSSAQVTQVLEAGGGITTVLSSEITISNDLDDGQFVLGGAGKRVDLPEGFAMVSGQLRARFTDTTLLNKAIAGTETALKIVVQRGTGAGSAGNEYFDIEVKAMRYEPASAPIEGPRGLILPLNFQGYVSGADLGLKITTKTPQATY